MDVVILARLQFAVTTVYHFFFVPLTLGLAVLVAAGAGLVLGAYACELALVFAAR